MTAPRGRGRPRDPATDLAVLTAGLELFVERGVEGTSFEQIARRAGVGKVTVYRRWKTREELLAHAIETLVASEVRWPSDEQIDTTAPDQLVEAAVSGAAEAATDPRFRALIASIYGSAVSNPLLMKTYWTHYVLPRRRLTARLIDRARAAGTVPADADTEVLIDMMVGAVTYRVLQPDPPGRDQMEHYLREVYRRAGLLR